MSKKKLSELIADCVEKGFSPLVPVLDRLLEIDQRLTDRRKKLIAQARSVERPQDYEPTESDLLIEEHNRGQSEGIMEVLRELHDFRVEISRAILDGEEGEMRDLDSSCGP